MTSALIQKGREKNEEIVINFGGPPGGSWLLFTATLFYTPVTTLSLTAHTPLMQQQAVHILHSAVYSMYVYTVKHFSDMQ